MPPHLKARFRIEPPDRPQRPGVSLRRRVVPVPWLRPGDASARKLIRCISQLLVVAALLAGIGGHWVILQTVAWSTMLVDNLQRTSVAEAVSNTFDGEHPCSMCKAIKQGRAEEKQPDKQQVKTGSKLDLGVIWQATLFTLTQAREWVPASDLVPDSHNVEPPKPRPRALAHLVAS